MNFFVKYHSSTKTLCEHFLGVGPYLTCPVILRFFTEKTEEPRSPDVPQDSTGTHPTH